MDPKESEKWIWTDADFDVMGWHDCRIHALAFSPETFELLLDIDYIFEWIRPTSPETYFKFKVAPATMVFENVHSGQFDIDPCGGIEIQSITRIAAGRPSNAEHIGRAEEWSWTIECVEGELSFKSIGYKQFIRQPPILLKTQCIPLEQRGFSFSRGRAALAP